MLSQSQVQLHRRALPDPEDEDRFIQFTKEPWCILQRYQGLNTRKDRLPCFEALLLELEELKVIFNFSSRQQVFWKIVYADFEPVLVNQFTITRQGGSIELGVGITPRSVLECSATTHRLFALTGLVRHSNLDEFLLLKVLIARGSSANPHGEIIL